MKSRQTSIPCSIIRGGTSRGAYFLVRDIPGDTELRDRVLMAVMGGPDSLQVDGIGGGHPLTSKVAIVGPSSREDADVDYLFLQVSPDHTFVSTAQNCGNILAGVGPFAIDNDLVKPGDAETRIRVHMINSVNLCELTLQTPDGVVDYEGETNIDGVPGTSAAITCDFLDVAGSVTGALLPTGKIRDVIDGVELTCIDNGMPVVVMRASDFDCSGYETADELDANEELKARLEKLRLMVGPMMNLGDVSNQSVPKMCLVAEPSGAGNISARVFIPHVCHRSIGVLGAVTVATACLLPGSVTNGIAVVPAGSEKNIVVQHPSGTFLVRLRVDEGAPPENLIKRAGVIRTARTLMRGNVFISSGIWDGHSSASDRSGAD
jgi:4-oxalomesaconate tautomerase